MTAFHLNVDQGEEVVLAALHHNRNSHFVCVETKQQIVQRNRLLAFFDRLARFHCMKQCFIKKIQALPAESLAALLDGSQKLEFLYLQNVSLQADQQSIQTLADAFRLHQGLRKVRFWMSKPATGTNISLESILSALSSIQTLEEVTLIHSKIVSSDDQQWAGSSLQDLCRSKSLKVLTLTFNTATLKDEHIVMMAKSLQSNTVLQNLSIRGILGKEAGLAVANLLKANTKLEQLRLQLDHDDQAIPIVEALHHNSSLRRLGLILPRGEDTNVQLRIHFTTKVTDMLRTGNYHLLNMDMGCFCKYDSQEQIRFYLKLNQTGRERLLGQGATRDEWIETLASNVGDTSIVYYFLSKNPSLALIMLSKLIIVEPSPLSVTTSSMAGRKRIREKAVHNSEGKESCKKVKHSA